MVTLPGDLVTFTEEILNGKLHFLCSTKTLISNRQEKCGKVIIVNISFKHKIYFCKLSKYGSAYLITDNSKFGFSFKLNS